MIFGKTNVPLYAGDHQTYNGVYGLKPSWGVISSHGHIPRPPGDISSLDLNVMGPLARSVGDLELLLDASIRFGGMRLGGQADVPDAKLEDAGPIDLEDLRVGLWLDETVSPVDSVTHSTIEAFAQKLESAGASVDESARPALESADLHDIYARLLAPVMAARLPERTKERLAGIAEAIDGPLDAGDPSTFAARNARNSLAPHSAWLSANERRAKAQVAWNELFAKVDVVLMPVSQTQAFLHDTDRPYSDRTVRVDRGPDPDPDPDRAYHDLLFWAGLATMPPLQCRLVPSMDFRSVSRWSGPAGRIVVCFVWAQRSRRRASFGSRR